LVIAVNKKIPQLYKKNALNIKASVIGHSLNLDKINFAERKECNGKLVSIGRLVPEKGFKYIIEAINILKNKYPTLKLDIYGEGLLKSELLYYIRKKNLANHVFLKGHIAYENLINKLCEYDLFISHPLETPWIAEAFLIANMEAMAAGLPVITSDCGGVPYIVRDKAIVIKQKDVDGIAITIEEFMRDPQKVKRYSVEGRKYIEDNFRIEFIAKRWDKAIRDFLKISSMNL
jgi:glycosyltransferase involved in cell wall biosynthesis